MARIRVFVNEQPVEIDEGAPAGEAATAGAPELGAALAEGTAYLTDGVGRRLDPGAPLTAGAIVRIVRSARRPASPPAAPAE